MVAGDITGPIDDLEYVTNNGYHSYIVHISGDVYAITYSDGPTNVTRIRTMEIQKNGTIVRTIDGPDDIDPTGAPKNPMIHIDGTVYCMAGFKSGGNIRTIDIHDDGTIVGTIDTHKFDANYGDFITIDHLAGEIYVVVCIGQNGWYLNVYTIRIQSNGTIVGNIDDWRTLVYPRTGFGVTKVSDNIIALAYGDGAVSAGRVMTVSIQSNGTITGTISTGTTFTDYWYNTDIINISGDKYIVGHGKTVETFSISDSGIVQSIIDKVALDTDSGVESMLIHCDGDIYALVYRINGGPNDNTGRLATVGVKSNGLIDGLIDKCSGYGYCAYPSIVHGRNDMYPIAFRSYGADLWIKTFTIGAPSGIISPRFTGGLSHRSIH